MHYSTIKHWRDNVPQQGDLSWGDFCDQVLGGGVQPTQHTDKRDTPAFSPVEYATNAKRGNENVISVSMVVLDYDALDGPQTKSVLEEISGLKHVIYSTYSHGKKHKESTSFSFRVVLPLSHPVPASEWPGFWARFQAQLPVPSDPSCKDPARIYGLPFTPEEDLDASFFEIGEGPDLDVNTVMTWPLPAGAVALPSNRVQIVGDTLDVKLVKAHGKALQKKKNPEVAQLGTMIVELASGRPWMQEQGQRHAAMLPITKELDRKFSSYSLEALTAVWERSVTALADGDPTWDPNQRLADIRRAYDKPRRERLEASAQRETDEAKAKAAVIAQARGDGSSEVYGDTELAELRNLAGLPVDADLTKFWVRTLAGAHYVLTLRGYIGPYVDSDVMQICRDYLAPAKVKMTEWSEPKQKEVKMQTRDFMHAYSTPIVRIVVDTTTDGRGYVDDEGTLHEPACVLRKIPAVFNAKADEYITRVGGVHAEKFKDWLATYTHTKRPTCAIYFAGPAGTGKTRIPTMLAAMYAGKPSPTQLKQVLSNFNADLARSPGIFQDEKMSKHTSSGDLRILVGTSNFTLTRKFLPTSTIIGCPRLILSANNHDMLKFQEEEHTTDDIDAISGRFLFLSVGQDVADWINANEGYDLMTAFTEGVFEQHVMWLQEQRAARVLTKKDRWLVTGEASEVQAITSTSSPVGSGICQWVAKYFENPKMIETVSQRGVQVDARGVWVNSRTILDTWETVVRNNDARISDANVTSALAALAVKLPEGTEDRRYIGPPLAKKRSRFRLMRMDVIAGWARRMDMGSVTDVLDQLAKDPEAYCRQQQELAN